MSGLPGTPWTEYRIPRTSCPHCEQATVRATGGGPLGTSRAPVPGDVTVCIECAGVAVYGGDLSLRKPRADELEAFARDGRITLAVAAIRFVRMSEARP